MVTVISISLFSAKNHTKYSYVMLLCVLKLQKEIKIERTQAKAKAKKEEYKELQQQKITVV